MGKCIAFDAVLPSESLKLPLNDRRRRPSAELSRPFACGQIDVGNAPTEMARKQTQGVRQADGRIAPEPMMDVNEVGEAVPHMASLPLSTYMLTMTIMATKMPYVGRG